MGNGLGQIFDLNRGAAPIHLLFQWKGNVDCTATGYATIKRDLEAILQQTGMFAGVNVAVSAGQVNCYTNIAVKLAVSVPTLFDLVWIIESAIGEAGYTFDSTTVDYDILDNPLQRSNPNASIEEVGYGAGWTSQPTRLLSPEERTLFQQRDEERAKSGCTWLDDLAVSLGLKQTCGESLLSTPTSLVVGAVIAIGAVLILPKILGR